MASVRKEISTQKKIVAIARQDEKLYAVCLQKHDEDFKILWKRSCNFADLEWEGFTKECDISVEASTEMAKGQLNIVIGYDSSGVGFYKLKVPAVKKDEIAAMVRLQSEARMPLPPDKIELGWRVEKTDRQELNVIVAGARREPLEQFVSEVEKYQPEKIVLDCEGIAAVWERFFSGGKGSEIVLNLKQQNTQVCFIEEGQLSNFMNLGMGTDDLEAENEEATIAKIERFAVDLKNVIEMFGYSGPKEIKTYVLSDGGDSKKQWVSYLEEAGFDIEIALPSTARFVDGQINIEDVYEYRTVIGLCVQALEGEKATLNIFERLYTPKRKEQKKHWRASQKVTTRIAAIMLILTVAVFYFVDAIGVIRMDKLWRKGDCEVLVQRQKLIRQVARCRPDILALLKEINSCKGDGLLLDGIDFKKGRPVLLYGQVSNDEQLYKFQKSLKSKKGIAKVQIQSTEKNDKNKKLKFTMSFHYRSFSKKSS